MDNFFSANGSITPGFLPGPANGSSNGNLAVLPVTLLMGPQALQSPDRTIQLAAAPLALDNGTQLTLATAMGKVEINISPAIKAADFNLVQILNGMVDAQRALTLTVQQTNGKLLASLIVPTPVTVTQTQTTPPTAQTSLPTAPAPTLPPSLPAPLPGMTLQAIILPPPGLNTSLPTAPQAPQQQPTYQPIPAQQGAAVYQQVQHPIATPPNNSGSANVPLPTPLTPTQTLPAQPLLPFSAQPSLPQQTTPTPTAAPQPQTPPAQQTIATPLPHTLFTGRTSPAALYAAIQQAFAAPSPQTSPQAPLSPPNQQAPVQISILGPLPPQPSPASTPPSYATPVLPQPPQQAGQASAPTSSQPQQPFLSTASPPPQTTEAAPQTQAPTLSLPRQNQLPEAKQATPPPSFTPALPQTDLSQRPLPPVLQQPGAQVQLRVVTLLPPTATPDVIQKTLANLPPNTIAATVTNQTPDGKVLASANGASFFVNTPTSTPVGSTLIVAVEQAPEPFTVVLPHVEAASFPSLPPLLAALSQVDPLTYQQVMARMPKTDDMAGALLYMLGAYKRGNAQEWIGERAIESLRAAGKASILSSLTQDMKAGGQTAHDATVGDWRSYPIPLLHQGQFQAVTLYVHKDRDPHGNESDNTNARSRFLIDVRLSKLGEMQLDGFVRNRKLDMVLRSETPLPDGLHHEIRTAYMNAISAVGYAGSMNFQVGRQHWVVPQAGGKQILIT